MTNNNANAPSWSLSGYTVNRTTGSLTTISNSLVEAAYGALAATFDPSGKFLYQIGYFGSIWGFNPYSVNSTSGAVNEIVGCHTPCPNSRPSALAVDPTGKFLYVTDPLSDYVSASTIDSATGELELVSGSPTGDSSSNPTGPYATGKTPNAIAVDPSGKFAYVANLGSNTISAYAINGATGALSIISGSPFATGIAPSFLAIVGAPSNTAFETFKVKVDIDEDRKTTFLVDGFFTLGSGSDGIEPVSETVALQVGSYSVTLPAGSFRERGRHEYEFNGTINDVDLKIRIYQYREHVKGVGKEEVYLFTAESRGNILKGTKNPVAVGLTIGDDEGSATVRADIDK